MRLAEKRGQSLTNGQARMLEQVLAKPQALNSESSSDKKRLQYIAWFVSSILSECNSVII